MPEENSSPNPTPEFLRDPAMRDALKRAIEQGVRVALPQAIAFANRQKEVGPLVALAEMEDRESRLAMARTLHEVLIERKKRDKDCSGPTPLG